ncbi:MAG: hypothetical protein R3B13_07355 [Polyangiaceae bacterium]
MSSRLRCTALDPKPKECELHGGAESLRFASLVARELAVLCLR